MTTAANEGLLIRQFRDAAAVFDPQTERMRGGWAAESEACSYYLENRLGPRQLSLTVVDRLPGRSLSEFDPEATCQEIERAIRVSLPGEWQAPTVVAAATGASVTTLRLGILQRRFGLTDALPPLLLEPDHREGARHLKRRVTMLREELIARRIVVLAANDSEGREPVAEGPDERKARVSDEPKIHGWSSIASIVGMSEDTVQRWALNHGMPVYQVAPGCTPWAVRSQLEGWLTSRTIRASSLR